jgi:hypothetical protein
MYLGPGFKEAYQSHIAHLANTMAFDEVRVGIVGPPAERRNVRKYIIPSKWKVVAEANEGFEQVTLAAIDVDDEDLVAYSHTKGAGNPHAVNRRWREHLEQKLFEEMQPGWLTDICVPNWLTESVTGVLPEGCAGFSPGNYFWAWGYFLNKLPEIDMSDRYAAETWIGMGNPQVEVIDDRPWDARRWM